MRASTLVDHLINGMADYDDFTVVIACKDSRQSLPVREVDFERDRDGVKLVIGVEIPKPAQVVQAA